MGEENVLVPIRNTSVFHTGTGSFAAHKKFIRLAEENRKAIQVSIF